MAVSTFIRLIVASVLVMCAALPHAVLAFADDPLIEGAKMCTKQISHNERRFGIPLHLLSAVATTESGRYHNGLKMTVPWPWTINVQGKGYYFDTKEQAIAKVRKYNAQGITSIDVGCMQVNLHHHPKAFASLQEAFEPRTNVEYAAKFLKNNYTESNSWKTAAAIYHSRTKAHGGPYSQSVYNAWRRIVNEVRLARGEPKLAEGVQLASLEGEVPVATAADYESSSQEVVMPRASKYNKSSSYRAPRMRIIELSDSNPKYKGTQIKRGTMATTAAPEVVKVTQVAYSTQSAAADSPLVIDRSTSNTLALNNSTQAKVIEVSPSGTASVKRGPNFIFN